ncbi:MAG: sigma-70 family RNA polymerase sigma factor [Phycisphaeraceae bacterium]|nr:sigma-70 family RNA polymerase sigma factor [Phycisphaeraceae bacterium]
MSDGQQVAAAPDRTGLGGWGSGWAAIDGEDAICAVWEQHRRWVAAVLLAHKPREADLEDLLQEVARLVVAKVGEVRDPGALKAWLRVVAISVAKTAARRKRPEQWWRRAAAHSAGGTMDEAPAPDRVAAAEEGRRLMVLARELPEGYREPLLMKCIRGMSYRQIGELMGLPETTIETRIARGRRMLRELADGRGVDQVERPLAGVPAKAR